MDHENGDNEETANGLNSLSTPVVKVSLKGMFQPACISRVIFSSAGLWPVNLAATRPAQGMVCTEACLLNRPFNPFRKNEIIDSTVTGSKGKNSPNFLYSIAIDATRAHHLKMGPLKPLFS